MTYVKAINAETLELRLVHANAAVQRKLAHHDAYWGARKIADKLHRTDAVIIKSQELWDELRPYFDFSAEVSGRAHKVETLEEVPE